MRYLFKRFLILVIFQIVPYSLFSQINFKNSEEAYNYWTQRGIIEMIYSSMEDYSNELKESEKIGKLLYYEKYIDGIDKKELSEIVQSFQEIEQFLTNNSYEITARNIFLPLKHAYEQHKPFDNQFFKVPDYYENTQHWDKNRTELLAGYSNSINRLTPSNETRQKPVKKTENVPTEFSLEESIKVWDLILIGFFLGLIIGAFVVYQYSKSKTYSILGSDKAKYLHYLKQDTRQNSLLRKYFKYLGILAMLKHSKDEKKEDLEMAIMENVRLKKENRELKGEMQQNKGAITDPIMAPDKLHLHSGTDNEQLDKNIRVTEDTFDELFFTIPEPDGSFIIINARNHKEIDCFYRIKMIESSNRGELDFISGEYDLRALENIDYYLNPVCEIQNISDRTFARQIMMTEPGSVTKRGDYWKIEDNNKVKIKLV